MGFPVFIVSLLDNKEKILASTSSSSYSLGDKLVIGMGKSGHTASQIKVGTRLAANFLSDTDQLTSDISGFVSARQRIEKLLDIDVAFSLFEGVPYLETALISVIGQVTKIVQDEDYSHIFITIETRLVAESPVEFSKFNPLLYVGDDKIRYYMKTQSDLSKSGSALRESRKQKN